MANSGTKRTGRTRTDFGCQMGCDRCNVYLLLFADGREQVDVVAGVAAVIDAHAARNTFANVAEIVEDLVRMFGTATHVDYSVGLLLHLFSGETKGKMSVNCCGNGSHKAEFSTNISQNKQRVRRRHLSGVES